MRPLLLHALHERLGAHFGEETGRPLVRHYGAPEAEYRAAVQGAALVDLSDRELLRCVGPDAETFLQGMVTQDVRAIPPLGAAPGALLTAKGAMVSDVRILRLADGLLLDVEPGLGQTVLEFLSKFLISEDAELERVSELAWLGVHGPGAAALLESFAGEARQRVDWNRLGLAGQELLIPVDSLAAMYERLREAGATPVGHETAEVLRVEAGLPRFGADMGPTTIPLEANLTSSISYTKGCYIGQEVIARATYRGRMNRHLQLLELGDEAAPKDTSLLAGEKRVGWLTSVVRSPALGDRWLALGYVHRDFEAAGTELALEGGARTAKVLAGPVRTPS